MGDGTIMQRGLPLSLLSAAVSSFSVQRTMLLSGTFYLTA